MSIVQALLVALVAAIAGVDYFMEVFQTYRPLVLGAVIGLIMGNLEVGLVIGATFELMFMGLMPIGGAQPPNMVVGTVIGTVFAIASNADASVAIGIGIPFSILMQGIVMFLYTVFAGFLKIADKAASEGDVKKIGKIQPTALAIVFVFYFVVTFLPVYLGADQAEFIVGLMPQWLQDGFGVASGLMPAIGFAILLNTMYKAKYVVFLLLGFVLVSYMNLPILAVTIIALAIAIYDYAFKGSKEVDQPKAEVITDGGFDDEL